jgi:hypothetical protein
MHEGDLEPEEPTVRLLVDQLNALLGKAGELALKIAHLISDVVHAGPATGEELADRRFFTERREQLDTALADPNSGSLHALRGDRVTVLDLGPEETSVRVDRLVEILDGHSEMVDPLRVHARGS